jgi:hypothetical protein
MKRLFSFALAALFVMATVAVARPALASQANATVVGSWDMQVETPMGVNKSLLIIKQEGDKLVGMMKSPRGERPLKSMEVKGNDITMVLIIPFQGDEMTITYKGKVEKDSMKGEADFGGLASGPWSAVPHKEDAAASPAQPTTPSAGAAGEVSGVWDFTVELENGNTGNPTFTLRQEGEKVTGTYKGPLGEAPVTGTIKGADVTLSYKINAQGTDLEATYSGKLTGKDGMAGTVKFSIADLGSGKWTAKKKQ